MNVFKMITLSIITLAVLVGVFHILISLRGFQLYGEIIRRVETQEKVIALTFDDAPTEYTDQVLDILKEKNVRATFYVIGKNVEGNNEHLKRIVNEGYEVGNHSYTHPKFVFQSTAFVKKEIDKTNQIIRDAGYTKEITFRPPYGIKFINVSKYIASQNIKTIMWDVEPDTLPRNTEQKIAYVMRHTKPGSIILMHPFCGKECESDREMLPITIDKLQAEGYEFVTVSELIER